MDIIKVIFSFILGAGLLLAGIYEWKQIKCKRAAPSGDKGK